MAYPGSLWGTWYKGRDPNPPLLPSVILLGCRPFESAFEIDDPRGRPAGHVCRVCGNDVRHRGYYCGACERADGATEASLAMARQDTDEATCEARRIERADHVDRMVRRLWELAKRNHAEQKARWKARQR